MLDKEKKEIIEGYIYAYNNFDTIGMVENLDEDVVFENISHGQVTLKTEGLEAFTKQAESAQQYFIERKQTIESWNFKTSVVSVDIAYKAILAVDLPNDLKAGDSLEMKGISEFEFKNERIIRISDKS